LTYAAGLAATRAYLDRTGSVDLDRTGSVARPRGGKRRLRRRTGWDAAPSDLIAAHSRRSALALSCAALASLMAAFAAARWGPKRRDEAVVVPEPGHPGLGETATVPQSPPTPAGVAAVGTQQPTMPPRAPVVAPTSASATDVAALRPAPAPPTTARTEPPPLAEAPTPTRAATFEPPPVRQLTRDKDGLVLSGGRQPGQLADAITAIDNFYVVSKNAVADPVLDVADWRLHVDGDVARPIELDYRSLRNLPQVEVQKTVECISNFVTKCELAPFGCELISTATWKGARVRDVVALAGGPAPGVSALAAVAADEFTTTLPIEVALDPETLVVYEMNGRTLAREHGFPARVLVPGRYGMKSAKWIVALRPLRLDLGDWYSQRGWTSDAVVKTMTRIDVPARDAELPPGQHRIAGIAYAGSRGIRSVELSTDGGDRWQPADILDRPAGRDVWMRWEGAFSISSNATLTLMARATDGTGALQPEAFSLPQPDGSTGWHSIEVRSTSG
jgi:DMSO/TMAO reductase YedYZ molybdopterin-dependent catalytic subunit